MTRNGNGYSFQTGQKNSFGTVDYVIFAGTLVFSVAIGVFYAIKDRKKKSIKDYMLAGGSMHLIPVAMSLLASFMSAVALLGMPAEMYNYTTMYLYMGIGYVICIFFSAHVYIPIFYNLKLTSAYEYLEKRFSKGVRTLGTCVFSLQMIIYVAIVLYGPSLALNAVIGVSLWGSIIAVGAVCTLYTVLGGMKAVLWTDTFQVGMMIGGLMAVLIQGCIELGGFSVAWEIASNNSRVKFDDFRPYPNVRHSFWALVFGGAVLWISVYGTNQTQIQRVLSCGSLRHAQIALWLNVPGLWSILVLCSLIGIVMYAFYSTCDPVRFGLVNASDQLLPLFVMDIMGHIPGLPGLFVACIFSGSLSTMSSIVNSLTVVILQDIIRPYCLPSMSESRATLWSRGLALIIGAICLALTYVASKIGGILQATLSLFGILGCPMLGLFTLGIFFPWANKWGAYSGLLTSMLMMLWLGVGTHMAQLPPKLSHFQTDGCNWTLKHEWQTAANGINLTTNSSFDLDFFERSTSFFNSTTTKSEREMTAVDAFYELSYLWYGVLAVIIVHIVGLVVSFATGCQDPKELHPHLLHPVCNKIIPRSFLKCLNCSVHCHKCPEYNERDADENLLQMTTMVTVLPPDIRVTTSEKDGILHETETLDLHPIHS